MAERGGRTARRRIGIVGFGNLGRYLYDEVCRREELEVAFVWNRSASKLREAAIPETLILEDLFAVATTSPDLIVEVAHPSISAQYGKIFLENADFMIGSPTALADETVYHALVDGAKSRDTKHGLYVPVGALWGGQDIQKMADRGTLKSLKVTMKKHPSAFKLCGHLAEAVKLVKDEAVTLFEGPVKELCPLAPNNVNTMACAAIAAHNLGFSGVTGALVADPGLSSHIVVVQAVGPGTEENCFSVETVRHNPASAGVVTGKQTYASFLSSLLGSRSRGGGVHLV